MITKIVVVAVAWALATASGSGTLETMNQRVDIRGIDKVELLHALWQNRKPALYFYGSGAPAPAFDHAKAGGAVLRHIDYFEGRCIKTDLSGNTANAWFYDHDTGPGTFQRIVQELRQSSSADASWYDHDTGSGTSQHIVQELRQSSSDRKPAVCLPWGCLYWWFW
ncbi:unnamed protein product (mitochondrion) [Plasmodiophora brassicae]|uniref:Uncharacterized protein n=1 Tax=Plasmodiophora brassicae TaxID=37360 RepID=A0A0G4J8T4_PLABS|nr:hypothetical protein PBRA_003268 [Plasmodiophora brassicae]SPQ99629.1 unnamed protein product [Plasmodiophora brassicae]